MKLIRDFGFQLKRYLTFNRSETIGSLLIIVLIIFCWLGYYGYQLFLVPEQIDFSKFEKEVAAFQQSLINDSVSEKKQNHIDFDFNFPDQSVLKQKLHPFPFNPNHLPPEKWLEMGLSPKQVKTILNFEAKGGKFSKKEDVQKMYCISPSEYAVLEPFIVIPAVIKDSTPKFTNYPTKKPVMIEINVADTSELVLLKGIGSGYAKRIIKYREKLGGFYKKEQLLEVWGMDTAHYQKFSESIIINPSNIRKININKADIKDLMRHPYIDFYLARSIVKYRNAIGAYTSVQQINAAGMIYKELYQKIEPYLCIQ